MTRSFDQADFMEHLPEWARINCFMTFVEAWHGARAGRLVPRLDDLAPGSLGAFSDYSMLSKREGEDVCQVVACGKGVANLVGFDPSGSNTLDMLAPELRRIGRQRLTIACSSPCGFVFSRERPDAYHVEAKFIAFVLPVAGPSQRTDGSEACEYLWSQYLPREPFKITEDVYPGPSAENLYQTFRFLDVGAGSGPRNLEQV